MERNESILTKVNDGDIKNGTFIFPAGITEIGNHAFEECRSLTNMIIPKDVNKIGRYAFSDCICACAGLKSIAFSENLKEIGFGAFYGTSLTSILIPGSVTRIGNYVFGMCQKLTNVNMAEGVIEIGNSTFANCTNLTSVTIPKSMKKIGEQAFVGCLGLESVTIPEGVTEISDFAFAGCQILTSITISKSVIEIGNYAFKDCISLLDITIPEGVIKIGMGIFKNCNLKNINIYSYETFNLLNDNDRLIAAISSIKNYFTGKIKYKDKDINKFKEYIKEHKKETYQYVLNDIDTLHFVFDNMIYSFDDIDSLIKMTIEAEIRTILLEYANKLRSQKSVVDIFNEKYDLDKYLNENLDDESFQKKKK